MFIDYTGAGRDALDHALSRAPAHLVPLLTAVRDHGCAFMMAAQSRSAFAIPEGKPAVVIIGDDLARSLGPPGFHLRSLRRFMPRCDFVAIMSGAPMQEVYAVGADAAVKDRKTVALIETTIAHEEEWTRFAAEAVPNAKMLLVSPTVASRDAL